MHTLGPSKQLAWPLNSALDEKGLKMIDQRLEDNLIASFASSLRNTGAGEEWNEEWENANSSKLGPLHKQAFETLLQVFEENKEMELNERRAYAMHKACEKLRELAKS